MDVPDIEMVGVEVMASSNDAVIVTVSEAAKKLSSSVSVKVTVGSCCIIGKATGYCRGNTVSC